MKFKALGLMKSSPGFTMDNHVGPVEFSTHAKGKVSAELGAVRVAIGEIPVKMRIPFLKRRHRHLVEIGSLGGVTLAMDPVSLSIGEIDVGLHGTLGNKEQGIRIHSDVRVACETKMEAAGTVAGALKMGSIDLGDDLEDEDDDRKRDRDRPGTRKK